MFEAGRPTVLSKEDIEHYKSMVSSATGPQHLLGTSPSLVRDNESAQLSLLPEHNPGNQGNRMVVTAENLKPLVDPVTQRRIRDEQEENFVMRYGS